MDADSIKSCLVLSIPRSGTHMIMKLLYLFGLKEYHVKNPNYHKKVFGMPPTGHYNFSSHMPHNLYKKSFANSEFKAIFITRDLRDAAVSLVFYIRNVAKENEFYKYFGKLSIDDCLSAVIEGLGSPRKGSKGLPSLAKRYHEVIRWCGMENVYYTTYEKMMLNPKTEIKNIADFLGANISEELLNNYVKSLPPKKGDIYFPNFRKGIIGDWKNYFKPHHKELFKKLVGQLLIKEGYEKDLKW